MILRKTISKNFFLSLTLGIFLLGAFASCRRDEANSEAREAKPVTHFFAVSVGDVSVQMQFAVRDLEMQRGLMGRTQLAEGEGMLFVYATPRPMSFWMKNTPLPLDIGFFDKEGILREVYQMYPFDERPVSSRSNQIQFALEVNQGWFSRAGVRVGTKLDVAAVRGALEARGFSPETFGL